MKHLVQLVVNEPGLTNDTALQVPKFLSTPTNVTVTEGELAVLQCHVQHLGPKPVIWRRTNEPHPLSIGQIIYTDRKDVSIDHAVTLNGSTWNLHIRDVDRQDAGVYQCRISAKENMILNVQLNVNALGSPPQNVLARPISTDTILIEWDPPALPNENLLGYQVFYTINEELPIVLWNKVEVTIERLMTAISGLTPEKTYVIRVMTFSLMEQGTLSMPTRVMTKLGELKIFPKSQKVAVGSSVVFTCSASRPGGEFTWLKSGRTIDEDADLIDIEEISDVTSVLRINNADLKRHRRLFTCEYANPRDGTLEKVDTKLKVLSLRKLHADFPHINPAVETSDLGVPQRGPTNFDITCRLMSDIKKVKWRWLKDDIHDLSFTEDFRSGRLEYRMDGNSATLRINRITGEDSGTYVCVADNNRGNAYGTHMKVQIKSETVDGCMKEDGDIVAVGTEFNKDGDICTTCECLDGGVLRCKSIGCIMPPRRACPQGQAFKMSEETCCVFDCFPDDDDSNEFDEANANMCVDRDGRRVTRGERYKPHEDPCHECQCDPGSDVEVCMTVACARPTCRGAIPSRDQCCNYTCPPELPQPPNPLDLLEASCRDNEGRQVPHGEVFTLPTDVCKDCVCHNGTGKECVEIVCDAPTCRDYTLIPGTCCGFRCPLTGDTCQDRDGQSVARGELYLPREDPCYRCVCDPTAETERCMTAKCAAPKCPGAIVSRDICCDYTCPPPLPMPPRNMTAGQGLPCIDNEKRMIAHGDLFTVPDNPCKTCACENGQGVDCIESICDEPPCRDYELIPNTCCGFRCPGDETETVDVDTEGSCVDYDGVTVANGEPFRPGADPCVSCQCEDGKKTLCRSIDCLPPSPECRVKPGTCCSFDCGPLPEELNLEKVLAQVFIRQVGVDRVIVQWKIPSGHEDAIKQGMEVKISMRLSDGTTRYVNVNGEMSYVILTLNPNEDNEIWLDGTLGSPPTKKLMSRRENKRLDGRSLTSLDLSDALGTVYESRGTIEYETYSLPRWFNPISLSGNIRSYVNVNAFHRIDVSTYADVPCSRTECGLLRFYVYTLEADLKNVVSLMFDNDMDMEWARAHL